MPLRLLFLTLTLLTPLLTAAQVPFGLTYQGDLAKVVRGPETLTNAWAGGLNSPQFSAIDLNNDQQPDLYLFDRYTNRSLTFLNVAAPGGGRAYQYAPEYEALFPSYLRNWVLLRDYDCDGRADLFTLVNNGVRVLRNVAGPGGRPRFEEVGDHLSYYNNPTNQGNINTGGYNLPAIQDVNGDGRLDIVTFDFVNSSQVELYLNSGTTGCGGLQFSLSTVAWGNFRSCASGCTGFAFGEECGALRPLHTGGHNLTLLDLDGDGDQDALVGRDYCTELVSLRNDGTRDLASFQSAGLNTSFPSGATPVRVANFPAAYLLDVTFDGVPDLVAAVNLLDNQDTVSTTQVAALYQNTSADAVPTFAYRQPDFLQHDMLDLGEGAAPTFGDLDGDGLLDLLVGSNNRLGAKGFFRASLSYFRNVGTATRPAFELVTNDYLGLAATRHYAAVQPVLADLTQDGLPELVLSVRIELPNGSTTNQLLMLPNAAAAGQAAAFNLAAAQPVQNLPDFPGDAPCFADVDGDGRPDLLLGTSASDQTGPGLRYYRNTGARPLGQAFALADADYGQLRGATGAQVGGLRPAVADFDGDGQPDLLTTDAAGAVRLFADFRHQTGAFAPLNEVFYNATLAAYQTPYLGSGASNRLTPAAADLTGDQRPELFMGLESGGLLLYGQRGGAVLVTAPPRPAVGTDLQIFPNPATATATVRAAEPVRVALFDLTGRQLSRTATLARTQQLNLQELAAGVYIVQAETADGQRTTRRLVVR